MHNLDTRIREYRTTTATLTINKEDGSPLAGQKVTVAQKNHGFLFGSNGFFLLPLANNELTGKEREQAEKVTARFLDLMNYVTLPFYWGRFEPVQGQPDTERLLNTAKWCREHHLLVKGHPLCWHTLTADWLLSMTNEEILQTRIGRIKREVTFRRSH